MCGRFTRSSPPQAIADEIGLPVETIAGAAPRFNVCPSEDVLVVARGAEDGDAMRAGMMRWGLVPWFASDAKSGPRAINARAETLATTRSFRDAFARRRCLVVADGFYEWRKNGAAREPWFIRLRSRRPFVFAGVWERWKPEEGEPLLSCAIVTCQPNAIVAPIHDRMPVIVPADVRASWLAREADPDTLRGLLRPYPADEMEAYRVSTLVNAPRNDSPECIRPAPAAAGG